MPEEQENTLQPTFFSLFKNDNLAKINLDEIKPVAISAPKIEQMKKQYKTHRAAFDFDKGFCSVIKVEKNEE